MSVSSISLVQVPPGAVFAHYAAQPGGGVAVVSISGQVLAPSFFDLRHQFVFVSSVAGAGGWVVLAPAAVQSSLF